MNKKVIIKNILNYNIERYFYHVLIIDFCIQGKNNLKLVEDSGRRFFVPKTEKGRRGKMMDHLNSQAKGPESDSALERYHYHRRGNFLIHLELNKSAKFTCKKYLGKISQVY